MLQRPILEMVGGVIAASRSMPQHPICCVHVLCVCGIESRTNVTLLAPSHQIELAFVKKYMQPIYDLIKSFQETVWGTK